MCGESSCDCVRYQNAELENGKEGNIVICVTIFDDLFADICLDVFIVKSCIEPRALFGHLLDSCNDSPPLEGKIRKISTPSKSRRYINMRVRVMRV